MALLVNLAADEAAACLLLAEECFMSVALRAMKHQNVAMLKAIFIGFQWVFIGFQ